MYLNTKTELIICQPYHPSPHLHTHLFFFFIPIFFTHTRNLASHTQSHIHKYVLYIHAYIHTHVYAYTDRANHVPNTSPLSPYTRIHIFRAHTQTLTVTYTVTHTQNHSQPHVHSRIFIYIHRRSQPCQTYSPHMYTHGVATVSRID